PAWYSADGTSPDPSNPAHLPYYITNPDTSFESRGKWLSNDWVPGFYGDHYCRIKPGQGDNLVRWNFTIPAAGTYDVYAWWPPDTANSYASAYIVDHASGSSTVTKDQRVDGGMWNHLGTYQFNANNYSVVLTDDADYGYVVADAIKVVHGINPALYNHVVDNMSCPKQHYGHKSIIFRKDLEVDPALLKYKRILFDTCTSGPRFLDTFHRGFMFYTPVSSNGGGSYIYLRAYMEGKSDEEIWDLIQDHQPSYDYYDFSKRPFEQ
ncbi:MAG: hypothetical protein AB1746_17180, partial [Candidatus Zixiibacteriota bacterium]